MSNAYIADQPPSRAPPGCSHRPTARLCRMDRIASASFVSVVPIFFIQPPRARRGGVLDLDPVASTAGAVGRTKPLGDDAFAAERASLLENDRTVVELEMFHKAN